MVKHTIQSFECRSSCGACCIAPSISSPIPGMPNGKPAGEYCINLDATTLRCQIWGTPEYPDVCRGFQPKLENCGNSQEEAIKILLDLENLTS